MFRRLKVGQTVAIMPILAVIGFVFIILQSVWMGTENSARLTNIEKGYHPSLELSRDLEELLSMLQRGLQDAVAAADKEALDQVEGIYKKILARIEQGEKIPTRRKQDTEDFKSKIHKYYTYAVRTSRNMISRETGEAPEGTAGGEDMLQMLEVMQQQYTSVRKALEQKTTQDRKGMKIAFEQAQKSNVVATYASSAIAIIFVLAIYLAARWASKTVVKPVNEIANVASRVAAGDFSASSLNVRGSNEVAQLGGAVDRMVDNLRNQMNSIGEVVDKLSTASSEILALAKETESNAESEAVSVEETRRTMQGMLEAASEIAGGAGTVVTSADRSTNASHVIAERITKLNAQATKITDVSETIQAIADKTDILALNAALEGTKAGEVGRGFALVGGEMRRLAETVGEAVRQIKQLANDIRKLSQAAVVAGEEGQKLARETAETAKRITLITNQQRTATEQVALSMDELQLYTQQSVSGAKQAKNTADDLALTAKDLTQLLEEIRV